MARSEVREFYICMVIHVLMVICMSQLVVNAQEAPTLNLLSVTTTMHQPDLNAYYTVTFNCTWSYTGDITGLQVHITNGYYYPDQKCEPDTNDVQIVHPAEIGALGILVNVSRYRGNSGNNECYIYLPFGRYNVSLEAQMSNGTTIVSRQRGTYLEVPAPKLEYVRWIDNRIVVSWLYNLRQLTRCPITLQVRFKWRFKWRHYYYGTSIGDFRTDIGWAVQYLPRDHGLPAGENYTVLLWIANHYRRYSRECRNFYNSGEDSNSITGFVIPPSTPLNITTDVGLGSINITWYDGGGTADLFQVNVRKIEGGQHTKNVTKNGTGPYIAVISGLPVTWYIVSVRAVSYGVVGEWAVKFDPVQIYHGETGAPQMTNVTKWMLNPTQSNKPITPQESKVKGDDTEMEALSAGVIAGITAGGIVFVAIAVIISAVVATRLAKRTILKAGHAIPSPTMLSDNHGYNDPAPTPRATSPPDDELTQQNNPYMRM